jgi:uncharacterized protein (TIGR03435 family)
MNVRAAVVLTGILSLFAPSSRGIAQVNPSRDAAPGARFEAASIKVNRTGTAPRGAIDSIGMRPDGSFRGSNIRVAVLLEVGYGYPIERISGLPAWADNERYDINAKAPGGTAGPTVPERVAPMIRSLLADRFKLVAHTEMREGAVYELRLARADGRLGPGLRHVDRDDCAAIAAGRRDFDPAAPDRIGPLCGMTMSLGSLSAGGVQLDELANGPLTRMLGRPVINRTGLTGTFDVEMTFAFGETPATIPFVAPGEPVPSDPNRPTFFTAIQEQLGLKLQSVRGPVETLVIDRIERPDPD